MNEKVTFSGQNLHIEGYRGRGLFMAETYCFGIDFLFSDFQAKGRKRN